MLEFVDSDVYFVQDKNNFITPFLQVGSGSGSVEKSTGSGSGSGGPKITGSDRAPPPLNASVYTVNYSDPSALFVSTSN